MHGITIRALVAVGLALTLNACKGGGTATGANVSGGIAEIPSGGQGNGGGVTTGNGGTGTGNPGSGNPGGNNPGGGSGGGGGGVAGTPDHPLPPAPPNGGGGGTGGSDASLDVDATSGFSTGTFSVVPDSNGLANVFLNVQNLNAFQVVAATQNGTVRIATTSLIDPNGATVVSVADDPLKTLAVRQGLHINTLPYMTRGADLALVPGVYHQQLFVSAGGSTGATGGTVIAKNDPSLSSGVLQVNVFFVGTHVQSMAVRAGIEQAITLWRTIYNEIGVTLAISEFDVASDSAVLPRPDLGSSFYLDNVNAATQKFALNIFIGLTISNDASTNPGNDLPALGASSSIPGPAIPTEQSAVAVSISEHEGADGVLGVDDQRLLGETLAHEGGHYLGLFHPVEISSAGHYESQDPLADTPVCTTDADCISSGAAANVMFPTPVGSIPQETLSPNQGAVVNLQVIVN